MRGVVEGTSAPHNSTCRSAPHEILKEGLQSYTMQACSEGWSDNIYREYTEC